MGNILLLPSGKFCSAVGDNGRGAMRVWRQERTSARSLHLTGWLCLWSQDRVGQQLRDGWVGKSHDSQACSGLCLSSSGSASCA